MPRPNGVFIVDYSMAAKRETPVLRCAMGAYRASACTHTHPHTPLQGSHKGQAELQTILLGEQRNCPIPDPLKTPEGMGGSGTVNLPTPMHWLAEFSGCMPKNAQSLGCAEPSCLPWPAAQCCHQLCVEKMSQTSGSLDKNGKSHLAAQFRAHTTQC